MSTESSHIAHADAEHGETMTRGSIVRIAIYLSLITAVEFIFALILAPQYESIRHIVNPIYIVLTLFKAFLIVAYFMHLKF